MNRGVAHTTLRTFLGTSEDDPRYNSAALDPITQSAYDSLLSDIVAANPDYLTKTVTATPVSATSHDYDLTAQAADFHSWREVRITDAAGQNLHECRFAELRLAGANWFAMTGADEAVTLTTSNDTKLNVNLFIRYTYWPPELVDDNSTFDGIPLRYHDVVPMEMLFAFALGGESAVPSHLWEKWQDRRMQLISHVSKRGADPTRVKHGKTEWG